MTPTATLTDTDFKVADLALAEFGRKEIRLAEHEMPGLMSIRKEFAAAQPLKRRADHGLAAHDDPDGRADRDADGARRARCAGAAATSSPPRTTPRRRSRSAPTARRRSPKACRSTPGRARRSRSTGGAPNRSCAGPVEDGTPGSRGPEHDPRRRRRRDAAGPQGHRVRGAPAPCPTRHGADSEEFQVILSLLTRSLGEDPQRWTKIGPGHQRRDRGDDDRRPPPLRDDPGRHAAVPGDQRQRLGHEVQVRQPLRLPALAGRRHQPRDRRDDRAASSP